MSLACLAFFILIFVYIANPTLEKRLLNRDWSLVYFLFLLPACLVHWGSTFTFPRALKYLQSVGLKDKKMGGFGMAVSIGNPLTQNLGNRIELTPQLSRIDRF